MVKLSRCWPPTLGSCGVSNGVRVIVILRICNSQTYPPRDTDQWTKKERRRIPDSHLIDEITSNGFGLSWRH